ncbi:MAG: hypothetical protein ACYDHH_26180 [Solirubrobacteraceae bacterium]
MVIASTVDKRLVVHKVLITVAWVCCGLVIASLTLFVRDQLKSGSNHQVQLIAAPGAAPAPVAPAHVPGQPRRFIDGAAHDLTSPFDSVVSSTSPWVNNLIPDAIALLIYGGGIGFAARYTRGLASGRYR